MKNYAVELSGISDLLGERNALYGNAGERASRAAIALGLYDSPLAKHYPDHMHDVMLILSKIARGIVSPDHQDHWVDIIGYALMILERTRAE